jgi:hypothetical protein
MKVEETIVNGIPVQSNIYEPSDMSTQEQKDTWMGVCNTCEYKKDVQCKYCGCLIESLTILTTGKCPANKW